MTDLIADLKTYVTAQLRAHCEPVAPKTSTSQQKHLTVWTTRSKGRAIGFESGLPGVVNLWVTSMNVPPSLPDTVVVAKKVWKGAGWQDKEPDPTRKGRDGANSNLKPFGVFNTRPVTRMGVRTIEDARTILDHLFS